MKQGQSGETGTNTEKDARAMPKIKPLPKFLLLAAVAAGTLLGYRHLVYTGVIARGRVC